MPLFFVKLRPLGTQHTAGNSRTREQSISASIDRQVPLKTSKQPLPIIPIQIPEGIPGQFDELNLSKHQKMAQKCSIQESNRPREGRHPSRHHVRSSEGQNGQHRTHSQVHYLPVPGQHRNCYVCLPGRQLQGRSRGCLRVPDPASTPSIY